jgi:hypothetical protein
MELAFRCHRCGAAFCPQHRLPENHECQGVKKESGALPFQLDESAPSGSKTKFRGLVRLLKKKAVIILLVFLVMASVWATIYLTASPIQKQAYHQFLILASLAFISPFILGFTIVVIPKRRWVADRKTVTRTRGRWGGIGGGEESVSTTYHPEEREPLYKSKRFIKWSLIVGGIFVLFGFLYGAIFPEIFCYISVVIGGFPLGWGFALIITHGKY